MNESESIQSPEDGSEAALKDINNGLNAVRRLAQQMARGAAVGEELETIKEAIYQRVAKEIADLEQQGSKDEFGEMDPGRFEPTSWDKIKHGLNK